MQTTVPNSTPTPQPKTRPVWRYLAGEWQAFATAAAADAAQRREERAQDTTLVQTVCNADWRLAREL